LGLSSLDLSSDFSKCPPNSYRIADKSLLAGTGINNGIEGEAASCRPYLLDKLSGRTEHQACSDSLQQGFSLNLSCSRAYRSIPVALANSIGPIHRPGLE